MAANSGGGRSAFGAIGSFVVGLATIAAAVFAALSFFERDAPGANVGERPQPIVINSARNDAQTGGSGQSSSRSTDEDGGAPPLALAPHQPSPIPAETPEGPAQADEAAPVEPSPGPLQQGPRQRRLADVISIENLDHPERSSLGFPMSYFRTSLGHALRDRETTIPSLRIAVAFVEPRAQRSQAQPGTAIGYVLVALPSVPRCERRFGDGRYTTARGDEAVMRAVAETSPEIADWLARASQEPLTCPD